MKVKRYQFVPEIGMLDRVNGAWVRHEVVAKQHELLFEVMPHCPPVIQEKIKRHFNA